MTLGSSGSSEIAMLVFYICGTFWVKGARSTSALSFPLTEGFVFYFHVCRNFYVIHVEAWTSSYLLLRVLFMKVRMYQLKLFCDKYYPDKPPSVLFHSPIKMACVNLENGMFKFAMEDILTQLRKEMAAPHDGKLVHPPEGTFL
ncbi:hypothetical protein Pfo_017925 [Paulownia fortunei]|nr:hypothetical protein Pfo_017925 [Paulownia fortunei]